MAAWRLKPKPLVNMGQHLDPNRTAFSHDDVKVYYWNSQAELFNTKHGCPSLIVQAGSNSLDDKGVQLACPKHVSEIEAWTCLPMMLNNTLRTQKVLSCRLASGRIQVEMNEDLWRKDFKSILRGIQLKKNGKLDSAQKFIPSVEMQTFGNALCRVSVLFGDHIPHEQT